MTTDHEALYNADALVRGQPVMLLEGEIDCLTVLQAAGDLVVPVATGSVSGARRPRWLARLARASMVLVALDADRAGDTNTRYWLQVLPNARRWRPSGMTPIKWPGMALICGAGSRPAYRTRPMTAGRSPSSGRRLTPRQRCPRPGAVCRMSE
ncbi:MAG: toprim domain-containing protein [Anaerolineales bacterium]|nr:toprim domain-containing protein [Anaerolineales bacterium]